MQPIGSPEIPSVPRWRWLVIFAVLFIGLFTCFLQLQRHIIFDDDNGWLHLLAVRGPEIGSVYAPEQEVIEHVRTCGGTKESIARLEMRQDYGKNYWLAVQFWHVLTKALPAPADTAAYTLYISHFVPFMLYAGACVAWLILALTLWRMRDRQLLLATFVGISLLALATTSGLPRANVFLLIYNLHNLNFWSNFFNTLIYPTYAYSLFGFTPRNYAAVLLLAVVLLRWQGKFGAAYLFLLPCYLLHSSFTLLAVMHLLVLDVLQNRSALRKPVTLIAILTGLTYGIQHESLWDLVVGNGFAIPALLATYALVLAGVFVPMPWATIKQRLPRLYRLHERLSTCQPINRDVSLLLLLWLVGLVFVDLIDSNFSEIQRTYLWSQLHGRLLAAIQPVLFVGAAWFLIARTPKQRLPGGIVVLCLAMLVWVGWQAHTASGMVSPARRAQGDVDFINSFIAREPWAVERGKPAVPMVLGEPIVYYLLGRDAAVGSNSLPQLFATQYTCSPVTAP